MHFAAPHPNLNIDQKPTIKVKQPKKSESKTILRHFHFTKHACCNTRTPAHTYTLIHTYTHAHQLHPPHPIFTLGTVALATATMPTSLPRVYGCPLAAPPPNLKCSPSPCHTHTHTQINDEFAHQHFGSHTEDTLD